MTMFFMVRKELSMVPCNNMVSGPQRYTENKFQSNKLHATMMHVAQQKKLMAWIQNALT